MSNEHVCLRLFAAFPTLFLVHDIVVVVPTHILAQKRIFSVLCYSLLDYITQYMVDLQRIHIVQHTH